MSKTFRYRPPHDHPDYPARIVNISEDDFWSAQSPARGRGNKRLLAEAVRDGLAGRQKQAYTLLAAYHAQSLAREWAAIQGGELPVNYWAPKQTLREVLAHKLWIRVDQAVQFNPRINWDLSFTGSNIHSFYWILPLFYAYAKKPRADYAAALRDFLLQYYEARNRFRWHGPDYHPAYTALAASIKFHHTFPIYVALADNGHLTPRVTEAWMKLMLGMSRALYRRETDLVLGNQTITNAAAFGIFGSAFPEFAESAAMRRRALIRIDQNVTRGFLPDGGYFERSFDYGGVSLKGSAGALRVMDRHRPLPPAYRRRIGGILLRASRFFAKTFAPGDYRPGYADGCLARSPGIITAARDFFPPGTPPDLGVDRGASYHLPDTGFSVMRNGVGKSYALFNHGRCNLWHCHMDLLNLDVWAFGIPFLVEAGRFGSYGEPMSRLFRMPELHNTPAVDGQTYDERYPEGMTGTDIGWHSNARFDYASAVHRAYRGNQPVLPQAQDYRIRRQVVLNKRAGYFLVLDSALPEGESAAGVISQYWLSPFPFTVQAPGRACAKHGPHGLLVVADAGPWLRRTETRTVYTAAESTGNLEFPARHQLRLQCWSNAGSTGAIGCITLLVPFTGKPPHIRLRREPPGEGLAFLAEHITVTSGSHTDTWTFKPGKPPDLR
ncbi:MAG: hypothetical protein A2269_05195 [Lentisphaerae bacterium RIFOXYA12_FULL_60_10]|nr:MAG: hypothetical protein A2269_05195 [Lentisphaerae bacterium RIFOXYA12_FULL_60_10]